MMHYYGYLFLKKKLTIQAQMVYYSSIYNDAFLHTTPSES